MNEIKCPCCLKETGCKAWSVDYSDEDGIVLVCPECRQGSPLGCFDSFAAGVEEGEGQLRKAWITPQSGGLVTLSLSSKHTDPEYRRISTGEIAFPDRETGKQRHTVTIQLLSEDDLRMLRDTISAWLYANS